MLAVYNLSHVISHCQVLKLDLPQLQHTGAPLFMREYIPAFL